MELYHFSFVFSIFIEYHSTVPHTIANKCEMKIKIENRFFEFLMIFIKFRFQLNDKIYKELHFDDIWNVFWIYSVVRWDILIQFRFLRSLLKGVASWNQISNVFSHLNFMFEWFKKGVGILFVLIKRVPWIFTLCLSNCRVLIR